MLGHCNGAPFGSSEFRRLTVFLTCNPKIVKMTVGRVSAVALQLKRASPVSSEIPRFCVIGFKCRVSHGANHPCSKPIS